MTSSNNEIQKMYDQIKEYIFANPFAKKNKNKKNHLPVEEELKSFVYKITGIEGDFKYKPFSWKEPFKYSNDPIWTDNIYHIIFIEYGIRISININIIKKISILDRILIKKTGVEKPLRLNYYCKVHNKCFEGPYLFITELDPYSLIYNKPDEKYKISITRGNNEETNENYFQQKSIGESLLYTNWYN